MISISQLTSLRGCLANYCQANGIRSLAVFGSVLHGNAKTDSDLDLLVEFEPDLHIGFLQLARIENELSDMLGNSVDLRTAEDLSHYFRQQVIDEAEVLYAH
jgi:predicted nucleotidyltransferase